MNINVTGFMLMTNPDTPFPCAWVGSHFRSRRSGARSRSLNRPNRSRAEGLERLLQHDSTAAGGLLDRDRVAGERESVDLCGPVAVCAARLTPRGLRRRYRGHLERHVTVL